MAALPTLTRAQRSARLRGVYCIVNETSGNPVDIATCALAAGVRIVQYRAKSGIVASNLRALRERTRAHSALLILNDDWRAALAFDCDGVHLGPGDAGFEAPARVRAELGERLIGLSCGTVEETRGAAAGEADYVGVGPVYATASKSDAGEPIGIARLGALAAATTLPVAAIGGIRAANLREVRCSGVAMAAVISAVANAPDPMVAAKELVAAWAMRP